MGGKYKYLIKNIGLMTISSFSSKILSFLLVPLYTSVLTTEEYGMYDLYSTTAFLLMPLLSVCISDAVLRFTLDKNNDPKGILSVGMFFYVRSCVCVLGLILVNYCFGFIETFNHYPVFFFLYYALCLLSEIMTKFARGLERISDVAVAGILSSVTTIGLNILLLLVFPLGINGYFIANCISFFVSALYLMIRLQVWKYIGIASGKNNGELKKDMSSYSKPFILNQIGWWINNVSDRYIVTWICGTAANGIYSVAYKIPSILSVFQTIFNSAWTISAVKELDDEGSEFYTSIYRVYNCGMVLLCSIIIAADKLIAKILYANEFYLAWEYAPFLLISVVFGALSGLFGGIFTAAKDSKIIASSTTVGASINTILNIILVYFVGPIGAAIATLVSYCLVWAVRLSKAKKYVRFEINIRRDLLSYLVLLIQAVVLVIDIFGNTIIYGFEMAAIIFILFIYRGDIKNMSIQLINKVSGR